MFDIGTCLTVIVVPDGMFLVRFLLAILPDIIGDGFEDGVVLDCNEVEVLLSIDFLTDCSGCAVICFGEPTLVSWFSEDFGGDNDEFCCCCFFAAARLFTMADNVLVPFAPFLFMADF